MIWSKCCHSVATGALPGERVGALETERTRVPFERTPMQVGLGRVENSLDECAYWDVKVPWISSRPTRVGGVSE